MSMQNTLLQSLTGVAQSKKEWRQEDVLKKKSTRCERKLPISSNLKNKILAHRPSIKGTKSLFIIIKAIIIITRRTA